MSRGKLARLAVLEDLARQAAVGREEVNRARVGAALLRLSRADLEALLEGVRAVGGVGFPVQPWADLPDGEERAWARQVCGLASSDTWPRPPSSVPASFEAAAVQEEDLWARVAWLTLAALAHVMLKEGGAA